MQKAAQIKKINLNYSNILTLKHIGQRKSQLRGRQWTDNGPTTSTIAYLALNTLTAVPFITSNHSPDGSINHAVHCYAAVRIASTLVASLVSVY